MFQKVKLSKFARVVLQFVVPMVAVGYLIFEFTDLPFGQVRAWADGFLNAPFLLLILVTVVVLSGLNWALEAIKWRFLASRIESIKFTRALASVLYAIGVGLITPRQVGELMGKVVVLQKKNQLQGLVLSSAGSFVQFCITFFMGHVGLLVGILVLEPSDSSFLIEAFMGYSIVIAMLSSFIFIFHVRIARYLASLRLPEYLTKVIQAMVLLRRSDFQFVVFLSLVRYIIFLAQFHMLLLVFGATITPITSGVVLSITYLIMLGIPVSGLLDSGMRGSVALFVFQFFTNGFPYASTAPELYVVPAIVSLWIINIALPGLFGAWVSISGKIFVKPVSN